MQFTISAYSGTFNRTFFDTIEYFSLYPLSGLKARTLKSYLNSVPHWFPETQSLVNLRTIAQLIPENKHKVWSILELSLNSFLKTQESLN